MVFVGGWWRGARLWPRESEYDPSINRRNRSRKLVWRQVLGREGVAKNCNVNGTVGEARIRAPLLDIVVASRWKSVKDFYGMVWGWLGGVGPEGGSKGHQAMHVFEIGLEGTDDGPI